MRRTTYLSLIFTRTSPLTTKHRTCGDGICTVHVFWPKPEFTLGAKWMPQRVVGNYQCPQCVEDILRMLSWASFRKSPACSRFRQSPVLADAHVLWFFPQHNSGSHGCLSALFQLFYYSTWRMCNKLHWQNYCLSCWNKILVHFG